MTTASQYRLMSDEERRKLRQQQVAMQLGGEEIAQAKKAASLRRDVDPNTRGQQLYADSFQKAYGTSEQEFFKTPLTTAQIKSVQAQSNKAQQDAWTQALEEQTKQQKRTQATMEEQRQTQESLFQDQKARSLAERTQVNPEYQGLSATQKQLNLQRQQQGQEFIPEVVSSDTGRTPITSKPTREEKQTASRLVSGGVDRAKQLEANLPAIARAERGLVKNYLKYQEKQKLVGERPEYGISDIQKEEQRIRNLLGLNPSDELSFDETGRPLINGRTETEDAILRAQEKVTEEKTRGLSELSRQQQKEQDRIRYAYSVNGELTEAGIRQLAESERRYNQKVEETNKYYEDNLRDYEKKELARDAQVKQQNKTVLSEEATLKRIMDQEKADGAFALQKDYAAKGIEKSFTACVNEWTERQKYNEENPTKVGAAQILDEEMGSPTFDKTLMFDYAVQQFAGNTGEVEKYMKSRGFLESDIQEQKERYQQDVLHYTPEEIEAENMVEKVMNQTQIQADFLQGDLSDKEVLFYMNQKEVTSPDQAARAYEMALMNGAYADNPVMEALLQTRLSRLQKPIGTDGISANILQAVQENPYLFGTLGNKEQTQLLEAGFIPPLGSTLTPNARASLETKLTGEYDNATKEAREAQRQIGLMNIGLEQAKKGNMNAGAQAILVTFQKILDPTSVVRESEYARSPAGLSVLSRMEGYYEQLKEGGAGVPLKDLQEFVDTGNAFMENYKRSQLDFAERTQKRIEQYGLDPESIFTPSSLEILKQSPQNRASQCGSFVNDMLGLTGEKRMGNTFESKQDAATSQEPIVGGFFVMDTGTPYGHTGIVEDVDDENIYIRDRNFNGDGKERTVVIPKDSEIYKRITGFGK